MSDYSRFKPKWTPLKLPQLALKGDPISADQPSKRPAIKIDFSEIKNDVTFKLYKNDGKESSKKPVTLRMDLITFNSFLTIVDEMAHAKESDKITFNIKGYWDHKGNKLDSIGVIGKIVVGRDSEGVVYVGMAGRGDDIIKCSFAPSFYADLVDSENNQLTKSTASEKVAIGWSDTMSTIINVYFVHNAKEPEKKEDKGSGSSGGYNKASSTDDWT